MVYGIKVEKFGQRIIISSIWDPQTVVLNGRSRVLLEYMNSPDSECIIVSYRVAKIWKCFG